MRTNSRLVGPQPGRSLTAQRLVVKQQTADANDRSVVIEAEQSRTWVAATSGA